MEHVPRPITVAPLAEAQATIGLAVKTATLYEGFSTRPVKDPAGNWEIGFGSSHDIRGDRVDQNTEPVTVVDALKMATEDMAKFAHDCALLVTVNLTAEQWAAVEDFCYNLGPGCLMRSNVLRDLNAGRTEQAAQELLQYDHAGAHILVGLARRRASEAVMLAGTKPSPG